MIDLHAVASHYGGKVIGRECVIPTPGHSRRDRGTAIRVAIGAPDGVLVTCFNGSRAEALLVKDQLRQDGFIPARDNSRPRRLNSTEREAIERAEAERFAERMATQVEAARICQKRLADAQPADEGHPYLVRKRIRPERIWQAGEDLLVPMVDTAGTVWNVQTIAPDGSKRFARGAKVKGMYWWAGDPDARLVIGEGMATMAAIRRATGLPVIAALSAQNLPTVAALVRAECPNLPIIIAADDDAAGMKAARIAAEQAGASLALPEIFHHER